MELLENLKNYRIGLASGSPRRRELLGMLGVDFEIVPNIDVDEHYPSTLPSVEVAEYLAFKKAESYRRIMAKDDLFITADTVVINSDVVLGKPHCRAEACRMLSQLSGRVHSVVTGVAIFTTDKTVSFSADTQVEFSKLTEREIDYYVDNYHPFDKAGAYGIQEWIGCIGITRINGSFYNVMGLPLHRLYVALKTF